MRVLYDPQTFLRQRTGGISKFFAELIRQFDEHPDLGVEPVLRFRRSNNDHLVEALPHRHLTSTPTWVPRGVLYTSWWLTGNRGETSADLVHHTYYDRRFLTATSPRKRVVTVYDMIPELYSGTTHFTATHLAKRDFVEAADLIICISESTRRDLLAIYGEPRSPVIVIPLSVQQCFEPTVAHLPSLPEHYVLYVGFRAGYKDFGILPAALAQLRSDGIDLPLVVVGGSLSASESRLLRQMGLLGSTINLRLSDLELARAYAHATVTVQTSRYEGFGLVPLEAMASGSPVVAADVAAVREVAGDAIRYFTPGDAEGLAEQLRLVVTDDVVGETMRARGVGRARTFSPLRMAQRTADAYSTLFPSL